jgi:hypothetical protein
MHRKIDLELRVYRFIIDTKVHPTWKLAVYPMGNTGV